MNRERIEKFKKAMKDCDQEVLDKSDLTLLSVKELNQVKFDLNICINRIATEQYALLQSHKYEPILKELYRIHDNSLYKFRFRLEKELENRQQLQTV